MAVCATITVNGTVVADLSDYEIAAFCGDECRGVGTVMTAEKDEQATTYFYLRIRSNLPQGETISFRIYQKSTQQEKDIEETCDFENNALNGTPSSLMLLTLKDCLMGDVNGDNEVDVFDVLTLVNYIIGKTNNVNEEAADITGDGEIDVFDVLTLVNRIIGKN